MITIRLSNGNTVEAALNGNNYITGEYVPEETFSGGLDEVVCEGTVPVWVPAEPEEDKPEDEVAPDEESEQEPGEDAPEPEPDPDPYPGWKLIEVPFSEIYHDAVLLRAKVGGSHSLIFREKTAQERLAERLAGMDSADDDRDALLVDQELRLTMLELGVE